MLRGGKEVAGGEMSRKLPGFRNRFFTVDSHQYKDYLPVDSEIVVNY